MAHQSKVYRSLLNYRVLGSGSEVNVLSQQGPHCRAGKWYIPPEEYPVFLKAVADEIARYPDIQLHYLERPSKDFNQIKIDIDMRAELSDEEKKGAVPIERRYDNNFIESFIHYFTSILSTVIKLDGEHRVYIQEKRKPKSTRDGNLKDGIHIIIPSIVLPNPILHHIRNEVVKSLDIKALLEDIGNITSIDDVIDRRIIEDNAWFVYGCGKPEDIGDYYKVSAVYSISVNSSGQPQVIPIDDDHETTPSISEYITLFSNYQKVPNCDIIIKKDKLDTEQKPSKLSKAEKQRLKDNVSSRRSCTMASKEITPLLNCFHKKRADNYNDWWSIGVALYNMDDRNYTIWDLWSAQSEKYDKDVCFDKWYKEFPKCSKYALGLHTLKDYARRDNPEMFNGINNLMRNQFIHKWVLAHVREPHISGISIDTFANHVQKYINEYAKYKIVCADPSERGVWYKFKGHMWRLDKASNEIYLTMAKEIKESFIEARRYIMRQRDEYEASLLEKKKAKKKQKKKTNRSGNGSESDEELSEEEDSRVANEDYINDKDGNEEQKRINEYQQCSKKCDDIDEFLSNVVNKEKVIKDLSQKCYDDQFLKNLNENKDIFACSNGTLDLEQMMFRPGMPSDMSTINCGIDYPEEAGYNEYELDIQDFLDKIFPDPDIQDYVLNLLAEKLSGRNRREQFIICTGSGSNGKSQFFKLIQNVFGEYYCTFDNSLLNTPKKDANSASPAIASLKGIRLAFTTEPKNGQPFETDKLKELIGGDELVGRHLRQDLIRFIPQYMMGMMCNDIPEMPSTDDGVWRKVYVIPFEAKFVSKDEDMYKIGNKAWPHHFKAEIKDHMYPVWAPFLLRMLFDRFKVISNSEFRYSTPERVKDATKKYQMESNIYSQFFSERIIPRPGYNLMQAEVFFQFKEFATAGNYASKVNRKTFITQMERFLGKCIKNEYYQNFTMKVPGAEGLDMTIATEASVAHQPQPVEIASDDEGAAAN